MAVSVHHVNAADAPLGYRGSQAVAPVKGPQPAPTLIRMRTWAAHRWDEDYMILVHEPEAEQLTVALFHRSSVGPADEIGRAQARPRALPSARHV